MQAAAPGVEGGGGNSRPDTVYVDLVNLAPVEEGIRGHTRVGERGLGAWACGKIFRSRGANHVHSTVRLSIGFGIEGAGNMGELDRYTALLNPRKEGQSARV